MTFDATTARQALLDRLGNGPASVVDLSAQMAIAGCRDDQRYFWARLAVQQGLQDRVCEIAPTVNGTTIYRLPAHTPMEKP